MTHTEALEARLAALEATVATIVLAQAEMERQVAVHTDLISGLDGAMDEAEAGLEALGGRAAGLDGGEPTVFLEAPVALSAGSV